MEKEIKHISGSAGGFLVGRSHANNGIKAINKATGQPLEMEGGEVVITKTAVEDEELREFEGEMLTNRQILSRINESGGGVSFALGGDIPTELYFDEKEYSYGGEKLPGHVIAYKISSCGCNHEPQNGLSEGKTIEDIAAMHNVSVSHIENQIEKGIKVEAEHTSNPQEQVKIAMDHLVENPNYYDILAQAHLEKGGELESKFLRIEKLILQELKKRGLQKEYRITSKSKTDYGESWYIKFENGLEIRISDHSVQSMFRVFDEKYVDFINVYDIYEPEMAVFTVDRYVQKSEELEKENQKIKLAESKLQNRIDYIKEKSQTFFSKLKNDNKGVFFHGFTRISPSNFSVKYPNSELIFPIETKGGYEYYYVGPNNIYSMKGLHPKYFNFLVDKGVIQAEKVEEKITYAHGGNLKKGAEIEDLDNVVQVSDNVLDAPNIIPEQATLFAEGGEISNFTFMQEKPMQRAKALNVLNKKVRVEGNVVKNYEFIESLPKNLEVGTSNIHSRKSEKGFVEKLTIGDYIVDSKAEQDYYKYLVNKGFPYSKFLILQEIENRKKAEIEKQRSQQHQLQKEQEKKESLVREKEALFRQVYDLLTLGKEQYLKTINAPLQKRLETALNQKKSKSNDEEIDYLKRMIIQKENQVNDNYETASNLFEIKNGKAILKYDWQVGDEVLFDGYELNDFGNPDYSKPKLIKTKIEEVTTNDNLHIIPSYKLEKVPGIINQYVGYTSVFPLNYKKNQEIIRDVEVIEAPEETLNSFPTDSEELKKSLLFVMQKLEGNKDLLSNIQLNYFETIVAENPKKELKAYYEAIQVIPENKREYFEHTFSDSKYNQLNIVEKLDDNPYNYLPEVLLPKSKVKKVDFSPTPDSVNLGKITDLFVNRDPLRPIMSGVYFNLEDERIEATNAHILLFIKEKPHVSKSCICLMGKTKEWYLKRAGEHGPKENQDGCWEIDGNYMRTSAVVPNEFEFIVTVDAQKLLDYVKASQYFIKYMPIRISFATEDGIQTRLINASYLENSLKAMLMLGYEEVDFCMMLAKNRAIAIVPKGNSRKISYAGINTDLVLTMPFIDEGAKENDFVFDVDNNKATLYYKTKLVKTEPDFPEEKEEEIEVKELPKEPRFKVGDIVHFYKEVPKNGKDGIINFERKDIITEVVKNAYGDIKYRSKEIDGNRIAEQYEQWLVLAENQLPDVGKEIVSEPQNSNEEIESTIEAINLILPSLRGKEKTEAKDTILALKLLLETSTFEKGGPILLAPNGKPSNLDAEMYHLVRTPQFKAWFGDWENDPENASKVVDENGEPLVVYHGSKTDFFEFDKGKIKDSLKWEKGFYFTDNFDYSKSYANSLFSKEKNRNPRSFFLNIKDIYAIHKNSDRTEYVAFEPNQIKLADGTNTTFDPNTNDIRYAKGGVINKEYNLEFKPIETPLN